MIDAAAPAQRLLDAVVAFYENHDFELPGRRYLAAGQQSGVAVDDEHLCVALAALNQGAAQNARGGGGPAYGAGATLIRAEYLLRLMRCVAVGDLAEDGTVLLPTAAQITADAKNVMADAGQLMAAAIAWADAEPHNATVQFGPVEPHGPEGGFAGHSIRVTLSPAQAYPVGP